VPADAVGAAAAGLTEPPGGEELMPKVSLWLLILFVALLLLGLNSGEIADILNSGTSICLSCIGLG
jgi:hypothetical protein